MKFPVALTLISGLACSSARAVAPSAPTTAPSTGEVEALVAHLASDDWKARQRAQAKLEEMGEQIAPFLRKIAGETADEEVRTRVEAALRKIEQNSRWGPTLITVHAKNAPLDEVLADVGRQANVEVIARAAGRPEKAQNLLTIDAEREPFWLVMRQICEQSGLAPQRSSSRYQVVLDRATGNWAKQPWIYHDGMLIVAGNGPTLPRGMAVPRMFTFTLRMTVLSDPKLPILRGSRYMKLDRAVDENGNVLTGPDVSTSQLAAPSLSTTWWDLMAMLRAPGQVGTRLATLKGSARFLIHSRSDVWEISDVLAARDRDKQTPMGRYRLKSVTEVGRGSYQVQVMIRQVPGVVPIASPVTDHGILQQSLRLLDSQGRAYQFPELKGASAGQMQLEYTLTFAAEPQVGPPAKLVWEIPQEVREVAIPIEFTDLPL